MNPIESYAEAAKAPWEAAAKRHLDAMLKYAGLVGVLSHLVKKHEWVNGQCPSCQAKTADGHQDNCELKQALDLVAASIPSVPLTIHAPFPIVTW